MGNNQGEDASRAEQRMRRLLDVPSPDLYRPDERIDWVHNPDLGFIAGDSRPTDVDH